MKKIIEKLIAVLPAIILQIIWYIVAFTFAAPYINQISGIMNAIAIITVINLIVEREEPTYKILWAITILLFPVFGTWSFFFFGKGKTAKKLEKKILDSKKALNINFKSNQKDLKELEKENSRFLQIIEYYKNKTGFPIQKIEEAKYYKCGEEMFLDMLKEIDLATKTIYLEYFIVKRGKFYKKIVSKLIEKVKQGVDVRLMYDDIGSFFHYNKKSVKNLKKHGIKVLAFNPLIFIRGALNNRNHRKIMIIDGNTVFTGGINLADEYINEKSRFGYWKDSGIKIKGTHANVFEYMFIEFWNAFSKEKISVFKEKIEVNKEKEDGFIFSYYDLPSDIEPNTYDIYNDLIAQSREYIWIYTPYLMIGEIMINSIIRAARRGVDIRIVVPGIPDKKFPYRITKSYFKVLMDAGVKIYKYTPGFLHSKLMIIDDKITSIGTVNLDFRSLFLHFENNSILYNSSVLKDIKADFEDTFKVSSIQEKKYYSGKIKKLTDNLCKLISPLF